ncbi:hydrolase [Allofrancisella guangzhouensis]|uniref:Hydrolase n=1 Tax=Allofrancisella guangzhouensis TaxID=594679 RepID=A0A0A8E2U8_9GAMM|nr:hydrolase [Allofrancisella guangzhouensis]AJC48328.1 hydrolase [Allofrancisella guangzhouensis]MBK2026583.1 hydrolase [Allofrancisella guangzhouensis]MBK2044327.1 hydrolase [Allofrancisella guangzhouensis]MBK2045570.1 hydrolase [Allofrancisella guangzhouensis]
MQTKIFSVKGGLSFPVYERLYGFQDKGISLGGAQDQLSFRVAYQLFNQPLDFQAIEMIYPAKITAEEDMLFILCGATYENTSVNSKQVVYNQIQYLKKGDTLEFSGTKVGFRTLVFAIVQTPDQINIGKKRSKEIEQFIDSNYKNNYIRIVKGPEFDILEDNGFFEQVWTISPNSSQMGLSLDGNALIAKKVEMISQPVVDGTIQLSPSGPIILMRHRQTVGGYPRVATVVEPDINKLAQFAPKSRLRFKLVSFDEAIELYSKFNRLFV